MPNLITVYIYWRCRGTLTVVIPHCPICFSSIAVQRPPSKRLQRTSRHRAQHRRTWARRGMGNWQSRTELQRCNNSINNHNTLYTNTPEQSNCAPGTNDSVALMTSSLTCAHQLLWNPQKTSCRYIRHWATLICEIYTWRRVDICGIGRHCLTLSPWLIICALFNIYIARDTHFEYE